MVKELKKLKKSFNKLLLQFFVSYPSIFRIVLILLIWLITKLFLLQDSYVYAFYENENQQIVFPTRKIGSIVVEPNSVLDARLQENRQQMINIHDIIRQHGLDKNPDLIVDEVRRAWIRNIAWQASNFPNNTQEWINHEKALGNPEADYYQSILNENKDKGFMAYFEEYKKYMESRSGRNIDPQTGVLKVEGYYDRVSIQGDHRSSPNS